MENHAFDASAAIYDLLYENRDSASETEWIAEELAVHGVSTRSSILELGAGTGRHARCFADSGFAVTAVEPSPEMLSRAISHPQIQYIEGDGRSIRLDNRFDAVLALFHVMSYQTKIEDAQDFLKTAGTHLRSGGIFGFDVWYSPAVHSITPGHRELLKENESFRVNRTAIPEESTVNSRVDVLYSYNVTEKSSGKVFSFDERHEMRHFSFTEIELLASRSGFAVAEAKEFLTGAAPSRETWGVWFLLRKE